jgi:hypothetical protein
MIERFYDPLIGRVTLDGVDIKDLNVGSYRSNVSLVSQEPTLYAGSVRFNVLLGASKPMDQVTEEEVVQACKDANIVSSLPSQITLSKLICAVRFRDVPSRRLRYRGRRKGIPAFWWSGKLHYPGTRAKLIFRNNESQSHER